MQCGSELISDRTSPSALIVDSFFSNAGSNAGSDSRFASMQAYTIAEARAKTSSAGMRVMQR